MKAREKLRSEKLYSKFDVMVKLFTTEMNKNQKATFEDMLRKQLNGAYIVGQLEIYETQENWDSIFRSSNSFNDALESLVEIKIR